MNDSPKPSPVRIWMTPCSPNLSVYEWLPEGEGGNDVDSVAEGQLDEPLPPLQDQPDALPVTEK